MTTRTRDGDITLCAGCNHAIQLRRFGQHTMWQHFRITFAHKAIPKRSMWNYDCYGNPT